MTMLAWYDDHKGLTPAARVHDACAAYEARYGTPPTLALVAAGETCDVVGVEVRESHGPGEGVVQKNTVWVAAPTMPLERAVRHGDERSTHE